MVKIVGRRELLTTERVGPGEVELLEDGQAELLHPLAHGPAGSCRCKKVGTDMGQCSNVRPSFSHNQRPIAHTLTYERAKNGGGGGVGGGVEMSFTRGGPKFQKK